jgi:hypothetical protein
MALFLGKERWLRSQQVDHLDRRPLRRSVFQANHRT